MTTAAIGGEEEVTAEVAIIGGTGKLGAALATRLVRAGHTVVLGSRDEVRARDGVERIVGRLGAAVTPRVRAAR